MNRLLQALTLVITLIVVGVGAFAQTPKLGTLYDQLLQPSETNAAAPQILQIAKNDAASRDFLSGKLPSLIADRPSDPVWANAVRLAGQLKLQTAIPALKQALSREPSMGGYDSTDGAYTMTRGATLAYDIVARALADIGDASIPVVADLLLKGDVAARRRAFWILRNIDSPAANQVMRDHLPNETDPAIKGMIQKALHLE